MQETLPLGEGHPLRTLGHSGQIVLQEALLLDVTAAEGFPLKGLELFVFRLHVVVYHDFAFFDVTRNGSRTGARPGARSAAGEGAVG